MYKKIITVFVTLLLVSTSALTTNLVVAEEDTNEVINETIEKEESFIEPEQESEEVEINDGENIIIDDTLLNVGGNTLPQTYTEFGDNLYYVIDDDVLTIGKILDAGNGEMPDYEIVTKRWTLISKTDRPWENDIDNITKVVINEGITNVGVGTFYDCEYITEVSLPSTLTKIEEYAFYDCDSLTNIDLSNVIEIEKLAFADCDNLASYTATSSTNKDYAFDAFYDCPELDKDAPDGLNVSLNNDRDKVIITAPVGYEDFIDGLVFSYDYDYWYFYDSPANSFKILKTEDQNENVIDEGGSTGNGGLQYDHDVIVEDENNPLVAYIDVEDLDHLFRGALVEGIRNVVINSVGYKTSKEFTIDFTGLGHPEPKSDEGGDVFLCIENEKLVLRDVSKNGINENWINDIKSCYVYVPGEEYDNEGMNCFTSFTGGQLERVVSQNGRKEIVIDLADSGLQGNTKYNFAFYCSGYCFQTTGDDYCLNSCNEMWKNFITCPVIPSTIESVEQVGNEIIIKGNKDFISNVTYISMWIKTENKTYYPQPIFYPKTEVINNVGVITLDVDDINAPNGKITFSLLAENESQRKVTKSIDIVTNKKIIDENKLTITQDNEGNLVISTPDVDFRNALLENDAFVAIQNIQTGQAVLNVWYRNYNNTKYLLLDGDNIVVSKDYLLQEDIEKDEEYTLSIGAPGYVALYQFREIEFDVVPKDCPEVTVTVLDNGDIKIYSEDETYIDNFINCTVSFNLISKEGNMYEFSNKYVSDTFVEEYSGDNYVLLRNYHLKEHGLGNGKYTYEIRNTGYQRYNSGTNTITLSKVNTVAPSGNTISISQNSNGDLIIKTSNDATKKFLSKWNYIFLNSFDEVGRYINSAGVDNNNELIKYKNGVITIPREVLNNCTVESGNYSNLYINAEGYTTLEKNGINLNIRTDVKAAPNCSESFNSNGDLIINFEDSQDTSLYLDNLFKVEFTFENYGTNGFVYITEEFDSSVVEIDKDNRNVIIKNDFFNNRSLKEGEYVNINLRSYNRDDVYFSGTNLYVECERDYQVKDIMKAEYLDIENLDNGILAIKPSTEMINDLPDTYQEVFDNWMSCMASANDGYDAEDDKFMAGMYVMFSEEEYNWQLVNNNIDRYNDREQCYFKTIYKDNSGNWYICFEEYWIGNGTYTLDFKAIGYEHVEIKGFELVYVKTAPTITLSTYQEDTDIQFDDGSYIYVDKGGLKASFEELRNDTDYLYSLEKIELYEIEQNSNEKYITSIYSLNPIHDGDNTYFIIQKEMIASCGISSSKNYKLVFKAYDYRDNVVDFAPSSYSTSKNKDYITLNSKQDESGNFVLTCENVSDVNRKNVLNYIESIRHLQVGYNGVYNNLYNNSIVENDNDISIVFYTDWLEEFIEDVVDNQTDKTVELSVFGFDYKPQNISLELSKKSITVLTKDIVEIIYDDDYFYFDYVTLDENNTVCVGDEFLPKLSNIGYTYDYIESSNQSVIAIQDGNGFLYAKAPGTSTIKVYVWINEDDGSRENKLIGEITINVVNFDFAAKPLTSTLVLYGNNNDTSIITTTNTHKYLKPRYVVDDSNILEVLDDGTVVGNNPGTTKVTAVVGSKKQTFNFTVYSVDPNQTLKIVSDDYISAGLQINSEHAAHINVVGVNKAKEEFDYGNNLFEFKSSNESIAEVFDDGTIVGKKAGTVTITATLRNDPNKRTAKFTVKVIPLQADEVTAIIGDTVYDSKLVDKDIDVVNSGNKHSVDYSSITKNDLIKLDSVLRNSLSDVDLNETKVSWSSSDTSVVSIKKINDDYYAQINKAGQVTLTVTANDLLKTSDSISLAIKDYSPVLESKSLTINRKTVDRSAQLIAHPTYDTTIDRVNIYDYDTKTKVISNGSNYFEINNRGVITLKDNSYVDLLKSNQVLTEVVRYRVNDVDYDYNIQIKIVDVLPKLTIKTSGTINSFDRSGCIELTLSSYDILTDITLDDECFKLVGNRIYMKNVGELSNLPTKIDTNLTFKTEYQGYSGVVLETLNISKNVKSIKPNYVLSTSNILVNPNYNNGIISLSILNKSNKSIVDDVDLGDVSVEYKTNKNKDLRVIFIDDGVIHIEKNTYDNFVNDTIVVTYKEDKRQSPLVFNLPIKVNNTAPSIKLGTSTVTINSKYGEEVECDVIPNISCPEDDIYLEEIKYVGSGVKPDIDIDLDEGILEIETDSLVSNGTYKYNLLFSIDDTVLQKSVPLIIKVNNVDPKVILKSTKCTLNVLAFGKEIISNEVKSLTGLIEDYYLDGYKVVVEKGPTGFNKNDLDIDEDLNIKLNSSAKVGNYSLLIYPKYSDGDEIVESNTAIKYTVSVINKPVTATLAVNGTLNPISNSSNVVATLKISNVIGDSLIDKANIDLNNNLLEVDSINKSNNTFTIKLKDGVIVDKDQIITGTANITTEYGNEFTLKYSIKVTRTLPTIKLSTSSLNMYNTTSDEEVFVGRIKLDFVKVSDVSITESNFVSLNSSVLDSTFETVLEKQGNDYYLNVYLKDGSKLKAGSTTTLKYRINNFDGDNYDKPKSLDISFKVVDKSTSK